MTGEETSTKSGRLKAGSRNGPAMPSPKTWIDSRSLQGLGLSPDQAVGLDRPELKPLEKAMAFGEGGSPLL